MFSRVPGPIQSDLAGESALPVLTSLDSSDVVYVLRGKQLRVADLSLLGSLLEGDFAPAILPVLSVASESTRLALTDLATGRRVEQADLPNVIWFYEGGGESISENWTPYIATNADGNIVADLVLPETFGVVPNLNVLGRYGTNLVLGDGASLNGKLINIHRRRSPHVEFAVFKYSTTVRVRGGTVSGGQYRILWWDGTITSHNDEVEATKAPSGGYENALKRIQMFPATVGDSFDSIEINAGVHDLSLGDNPLTRLYLPSLDTRVPFLDLSSYASTITYLNLSGIQKQHDAFGLEGCVLVTILTVSFETTDLSKLEDLVLLNQLTFSGSQVTAVLPGLLPSVTALNLSSTNLAELDLSSFPNLVSISADNNSFWSNATAMNNFFSSLPNRTSLSAGDITTSSAPAGDTSIATAKNWVVNVGGG